MILVAQLAALSKHHPIADAAVEADANMAPLFGIESKADVLVADVLAVCPNSVSLRLVHADLVSLLLTQVHLDAQHLAAVALVAQLAHVHFSHGSWEPAADVAQVYAAGMHLLLRQRLAVAQHLLQRQAAVAVNVANALKVF